MFCVSVDVYEGALRVAPMVEMEGEPGAWLYPGTSKNVFPGPGWYKLGPEGKVDSKIPAVDQDMAIVMFLTPTREEAAAFHFGVAKVPTP